MNNSQPGPKCLLENPFLVHKLELPEEFKFFVEKADYFQLNIVYEQSLKPHGFLRTFLENHCVFSDLDGIIAKREAPNDDEGIWHDDGSRSMGFSLSLNLFPENISGGNLLIRERFLYSDSNDLGSTIFPPQAFGTIVLFKTGQDGFEHRVTKVTAGKRIVLAGWCF